MKTVQVLKKTNKRTTKWQCNSKTALDLYLFVNFKENWKHIWKGIITGKKIEL